MRSITGLAAGEKMVDVDYRWHPNGELNPLPPPQLFGLAVTPGLEYKARLYTIDIETGVVDAGRPGFGVSPPRSIPTAWTSIRPPTASA